MKQDDFLATNNNKAQLIDLLSLKLKEKNHGVEQADDDADTLIVETAIEIAASKTVVVIDTEVDLLALLVAKTPVSSRDIFFMKAAAGKVPSQYYPVRAIHTERPLLKSSILFSHTISGCDTTSSFYRKGKMSCHKILVKNDLQSTVVDIFNSRDSQKEAILEAACRYVSLLYGAKKPVTLDEFRFQGFIKSATKSSSY